MANAGQHLLLRAGSKAAPAERDVLAARGIASRIASVGNGRVRLAVMLGSRALGTSRPTSDLDLFVVIETRRGQRWGPAEVLAERGRIQAAAGSPAIKTDLWVRTVEQFLAGRDVFGGIEYLPDREGVVVYTQPLQQRVAIVPRLADIRRENTFFWIRDAAEQLRLGAGWTESPPGPTLCLTQSEFLRRSIERSVMAVFVAHQRPVRTKDCNLMELLGQLEKVDSGLASRLRASLRPDSPKPAAARAVFSEVVEALAADGALKERLISLHGVLQALPRVQFSLPARLAGSSSPISARAGRASTSPEGGK